MVTYFFCKTKTWMRLIKIFSLFTSNNGNVIMTLQIVMFGVIDEFSYESDNISNKEVAKSMV